ncbi:hypothetical protein NPIL_506041 [Nephila pilipes]|uniref:Uncharacterized protein n=1 Tax=Nephila pilipes TaxID=299642 RepID=A0A8X6T430_NEPPI|nr:hypothetical protein NPIL_506041 [Nephila pilipes]
MPPTGIRLQTCFGMEFRSNPADNVREESALLGGVRNGLSFYFLWTGFKYHHQLPCKLILSSAVEEDGPLCNVSASADPVAQKLFPDERCARVLMAWFQHSPVTAQQVG